MIGQFWEKKQNEHSIWFFVENVIQNDFQFGIHVILAIECKNYKISYQDPS